MWPTMNFGEYSIYTILYNIYIDKIIYIVHVYLPILERKISIQNMGMGWGQPLQQFYRTWLPHYKRIPDGW